MKKMFPVLMLSVQMVSGVGAAAPAIQCENNLEQISQDLVQLYLLGYQLTTRPLKCLPNSDLKTIRPKIAKTFEKEVVQAEHLLPNSHKINIKTGEPESGIFEVRYTIQYTKNGRSVEVSDQFMAELTTGKVQQKKGCAVVLDPPKKVIVHEKCI